MAMPRPPLWRIIIDCVKNMALIGGAIAAGVAVFAGIAWCMPYAWALWVAMAQGVTLGGNPWSVLGASIGSSILLLLGLCVNSKITSDRYEGEPSWMDLSVVAGIAVMAAIGLAVGLTVVFTVEPYFYGFDENTGSARHDVAWFSVIFSCYVGFIVFSILGMSIISNCMTLLNNRQSQARQGGTAL
jgi:hypothetical protein